MNTNIIYVIAAQSVVYVGVEVTFLIMLLTADSDTWLIKKEALVVIVLQVTGCVLFIVGGNVEIFVILVDYFVPNAYTVLTYLLLEVVICVLLPIGYTLWGEYKERTKKRAEQSDIEKVLRNPKTFAIFLDFVSDCCWYYSQI